MRLPAELPDGALVVLVDTREKEPFNLEPLRTEPCSLQTGDYSIKGMEHLVAIERKSLPDLVACCGAERKRFQREVERLKGFPHKMLVVEADWATIEAGGWRGNVVPSTVTGSLHSWAMSGLPFLCLPRKKLEEQVIVLLKGIARRRWRELRTMASEIQVANA